MKVNMFFKILVYYCSAIRKQPLEYTEDGVSFSFDVGINFMQKLQGVKLAIMPLSYDNTSRIKRRR